MEDTRFAWYCCGCWDGPHDANIVDYCPQCIHQRCHDCEFEETSCGERFQQARRSRGHLNNIGRDSQHNLHYARTQHSHDIAPPYASSRRINRQSSASSSKQDDYAKREYTCSNVATIDPSCLALEIFPFDNGKDISHPISEPPSLVNGGKHGHATIDDRVLVTTSLEAAKSNPSTHTNHDICSPKRKSSESVSKDITSFSQGQRLSASFANSDQSSEPAPRFVCPFFKRNPLRYRHCQSYYFKDVSAVKYHLKRQHIVHQCYRCFKVLAKEQHLNEHLHIEKEKECMRQYETEPYRIDGLTESMLKSDSWKSKPGPTASSMQDQWAVLYRLIFPDSETSPSCYYEKEDTIRSNSLPLLGETIEELRREHELDIAPEVLFLRTQQYAQCAVYWSLSQLGLPGDCYSSLKLKNSTPCPDELAKLDKWIRNNKDRAIGRDEIQRTRENLPDMPFADAQTWVDPDFGDIQKFELGPMMDVEMLTPHRECDPIVLPTHRIPNACQSGNTAQFWGLSSPQETQDTFTTSWTLGEPVIEARIGAPLTYSELPMGHPALEEMDHSHRFKFVEESEFEKQIVGEANHGMDSGLVFNFESNITQVLDQECNGVRLGM